MKTCNFPECGGKHYAKGYCRGHYSQDREGRTLAPLRKVRTGTRVPVLHRDDSGRKRCSKCVTYLPETAFGKNAAQADGLANQCKDCQWSSGLWSRYRILPAQYESILESQGGGCAVCHRTTALAVDHDHACCPGERSCGKCVRGILCIDCNTALGSFRDDPVLIEKAIAYLEGK